MESQLTLSECREHTMGNLSFACELNVQLSEIVLPFEGQVSSKVMLPSNWKLKSSKRGSVEGDDVVLTELCILQTLPITWISRPNILVFLDRTASWEIRM